MVEIDVVQEQQLCIIYLRGDLVFSEVLRVESTFHNIFNGLTQNQDVDPPPVLINFEGVELIDSSGVAVLVGTHLDCKYRLIALGFCGFHERVFSVLKRTRVHTLLSVFKTEEEARQHLVDFERQDERLECSIPGILTYGHQDYDVECVNVSLGGFGISSDTFIAPEQHALELSLPDFSFHAMVYVTRSKELLGHDYDLGLALHKRDRDTHKQLMSLMEAIRTRS